MNAHEQLNAIAHARRIGRIERGREQLEVTLLEHHAAVRGAGGLSLHLLDRSRLHRVAQLLPQLGRGVEVRNEVPEVIQAQLARRRALTLCDSHVALI